MHPTMKIGIVPVAVTALAGGGFALFGGGALPKAQPVAELPANPVAGAQTQKVQATGVPTPETGWREEVLMKGFNVPWGMAFLPDGKLLVTERAGQLYLVDLKANSKTEVPGLPPIPEIGQGGLMDVALHPNFAKNRWVYFTAAQGNGSGNHSVLMRGTFDGAKISDAKILFTPNFDKPGGQHFGSRIQFLKDGTLLMTLGDGGNPPNAMNGKLTRYYVQDMDSDLGKILRLDENGNPPKDNPFAGQAGAQPEIYTLGHRNVQGITMDPATGRVFANEHGAFGGDEVNEIKKGHNYGWPKATFSKEYSGATITDITSLPGMDDPLVAWTPCPAPSAIAFLSSGKYGDWKGDLFSAGLAGMDIRRIDLDSAGKVQGMTRLEIKDRVRNVIQGPDGFLYIAMEGKNGRISRLIRD